MNTFYIISTCTVYHLFFCFSGRVCGRGSRRRRTDFLPAYIATGMPAHFAYGCNKFSSACGTTLASARFLKNRALDIRRPFWRRPAPLSVPVLPPRSFCFWMTGFLKRIVIVFLPVAAVIIFMNKGYGEENLSDRLGKTKKIFLALVIGLFIGFYDGMVGPGTGTFAIIAFSIWMKFDLKTASGNAKILNLASNYASLITYAVNGNVIWMIAVPAAASNVLGSYFGSGMALKKGAAFIRPMILIVMILLMLKIVSDFVL